MRYTSVFGIEIDLASVAAISTPYITRNVECSHHQNLYAFELTFVQGGSKLLRLPFTADKSIMEKWANSDYPINDYAFIEFLREEQLPIYNELYYQPFVKAWKER